jgi:hypothetical protein
MSDSGWLPVASRPPLEGRPSLVYGDAAQLGGGTGLHPRRAGQRRVPKAGAARRSLDDGGEHGARKGDVQRIFPGLNLSTGSTYQLDLIGLFEEPAIFVAIH